MGGEWFKVYSLSVLAKQGQPMVRLRVMPQAVLHNITPLKLALQCPDGPLLIAEPRSQMLFDWRPLRRRPQRVTLMHCAEADGKEVSPSNVTLKCHNARI